MLTSEKPVAVVVGGTGGIGAGACLALRDAGYVAVALSRNTGNFLCDVTNLASVESAFGAVWGLFGRMDVLVNAFGAEPCTTPTLQLEDAEFGRVWQTDVTGCLRTCREFLKYGPHDSRVIVNVASYHAFATYPHRVPYATAKAAVAGMTRALAVEFPLTAVNCILPGQVHSPRSDKLLTEEQKRRILEVAPSGLIPSCREIGEVISWLAKAKPWMMSGASIVVDGGWTVDASY